MLAITSVISRFLTNRFFLGLLGLLAATGGLAGAAEAGASEARRPPLPERGVWFDPAAPGTGFMWDVQKGVLAGTWYGYETGGEAVWYLFNGRLQAGSISVADDHLVSTGGVAADFDRPGVEWVVSAEAQRFHGGACITCPFVAPAPPVVVAELKIEFLARTRARFKVDGGEWQMLRHFNFGAQSVSLPSEEEGPLVVPDVSGKWAAMVVTRPTSQPRVVSAGAIWIENLDVASGRIQYQLNFYSSESDPTRVGNLICERVDDSGDCRIEYFRGASGEPLSEPQVFKASYDAVSVRRIWAESSQGDTFEAHRIGFD